MSLIDIGYQKSRKQPAPQTGDRQSLARTIAGNVLSPLAAVSNVLDIPGSMARDTVSGLATGDWKKYNPLDQLLTPTRDDNRATGREVNTHLFGAAPNDPHRWELGDVGGFLTEVALDPTTYLTGGLSGVGKALQGTGKASHLFKVGVPFTKAAVPVGKGAAQLLDKAAAKAWQTPVGDALGRTGKMLFDPAVKGQFSKAGQDVAKRMTESEASTAADAAMHGLDDIEKGAGVYGDFLKEFPHIPAKDAQETWQKVWQHAQETAPTGDHAKAFSEAAQRFGGAAPSPQLSAKAGSVLGEWNKGRTVARDAIAERGGRVGEISGKVSYGPRAATEQYAKSRAEDLTGGGLLSTPNMKHRRELIATIPQADIDKMLADRARYTGQAGGSHIRQDFPQYMGFTSANGRVVNDIAHSNRLRKWLEGVDSGIQSVHQLAPEALHQSYLKGMDRVARNLDAIHGALADAIDPAGVSIKKAFKAYGMDEGKSLDWFSKLTGKPIHEVDKLKVNKETAKAIQNVLKASKNPEWFGVLGEAVDKFNRMFKGAVTLPFPSFHIRNRISGMHMNLASEHLKTPADFIAYGKASREAWKMMKEGTSHPLYKEAVAHGMAPDTYATEGVELAKNANLDANVLNPVKGVPQAWEQAGKHVAENPEGVWPMGIDALLPNKVRQVLNTPSQYGSNAARATEFMNRMEMFVYLKNKGLSPKAAASEVNKLQVDYRPGTPFEKNVAQRGIPFYKFTKGIVPQVAQMLLDAPGGKLAQTIRASNAGRGEEDIMPAHIADTAAVPLNPLADGTKRYLTGFGLAPEAALPYLAAPADLQGALLQGGSALTPLLKMPLEKMAHQTFFQRGQNGGRPLNELDPTIGRTISNLIGREEPVNILGDRDWSRLAEHAAANSPASKLLSLARTVSDPRKGLGAKANNALLPTRVTDVSPQQQERLLQQASGKLADQLGAGTWSNRYFSDKKLSQLERDNPLLAAQARQLKELWSEAKRTAKGTHGKSGKKKARATNSAARAEVNRLLQAASGR